MSCCAPAGDSSPCIASSEQFREEVRTKYDWTVGTWTLTPHDCQACPYYQRAQIWGHLLYQENFLRNYQGEFYKTNPAGGLNKVTPFQLKQLLIEAGFEVAYWEPTYVDNVPPRSLTAQFCEKDLQTDNILFAADKPKLVLPLG
jgi:2-polyprenyl-6-hydroxyphenyl methylase/3-demethylubiquinone-9 3-methyltransferase